MALSSFGIWILAAASISAMADWWAVSVKARRSEFFFKPLTLLLLLTLALAVDVTDSYQRTMFAIALALSLLGDVALMLPKQRFLGGLAAFLVAHVFYIGGFASERLSPVAIVVTLGVLSIGTVIVLRAILARLKGQTAFGVAISVYALVLVAMASLAAGTLEPLAAAGGLLFVVSDGLLAVNRFVTPVPTGHTGVMITYHLAQTGLVLSLLT